MQDPHDPAFRLFQMAALVEGTVSDRKRRLFAVACLSRFEGRLQDPRSRRALEVAWRYAAGLASEVERQIVEFDAYEAHQELREARFGGDSLVPWTWQGDLLTRAAALVVSHGTYYAEDAADYARRSLGAEAEPEEEATQLALLGDILGPKGRPRIEPYWLAANDSAAVQLAQVIEEGSAFDLLPILADALEDAGCDSAPLLEHCRRPAPHTRGCWVIDLILGQA
ncbi:MAG: hypothetical protein U0797_11725 [Gemmataceae bacterium]